MRISEFINGTTQHKDTIRYKNYQEIHKNLFKNNLIKKMLQF